MFKILLFSLTILAIIDGRRMRIIRNRNCECGMPSNISIDQVNQTNPKNPKHRIINGQATEANEFPWIVGLYDNQRCRGIPVCGGTVISSHHILTAAHCVEGGTIQCASMGDHDLSRGGGIIDTLLDRHLSWTMHEEYFHGDVRTLPKHDIAILELENPIDFDRHPKIRPLCLPDPRPKRDVKVNTDVYVAGWGKTNYHGLQATVLQKTTLKIVSNQDCQKAYNAKYPDSILSEHLCAYADGTDACQGDSGGPLFATRPKTLRRSDKERMELVGIVSFGDKCAQDGIPGGYARANRYFSWIMRKMFDSGKNITVCSGTFGSWIAG